MRCPTHLSIGQEAVSAALSQIMRKKDFAVSSHRAHAHYMAKGGSLNFDTIFKISELAIFLPSLKRITNFFITRFSIHYE